MGATSKSDKNNAKNGSAAAAIDPAAQLHEIQKLLFGQQIAQLETLMSDMKSDMDDRLSQLEKQFTQNLDKQKKELSAQLSELSKYLGEVDEQHKNQEALLEGDIDSLRTALDQFEAQTESAHDSLEKQLVSESQKISETLDAKHEEALKQLRSSSSNLDDKKVDRETLAELFSSVAKTIHA